MPKQSEISPLRGGETEYQAREVRNSRWSARQLMHLLRGERILIAVATSAVNGETDPDKYDRGANGFRGRNRLAIQQSSKGHVEDEQQ